MQYRLGFQSKLQVLQSLFGGVGGWMGRGLGSRV